MTSKIGVKVEVELHRDTKRNIASKILVHLLTVQFQCLVVLELLECNIPGTLWKVTLMLVLKF